MHCTVQLINNLWWLLFYFCVSFVCFKDLRKSDERFSVLLFYVYKASVICFDKLSWFPKFDIVFLIVCRFIDHVSSHPSLVSPSTRFVLFENCL